MTLISTLFTTFLYEPLFNVLVLIYEYFPGHDFGIAVIVLTLAIRILLYPLMLKSIKSQKALSDIQPKMKEIQEKYKSNREKQGKELMELYKKEGVNPFGAFLPLILQIPILWALYKVFWTGLKPESMVHLYSFVPSPSSINPVFLGVIDLSKPFFLIAILAGLAQFYQTKMMTAKNNKNKDKNSKNDKTAQFADMMQKQMLYFFPILIVLMLLRMPSAIGLYWVVTALFSIWQQKRVLKEKDTLTAVKTN